jgi:biopolymer transport protein ExbD
VKFGRADHPREASFDLTPMIDVVFLLIIFFTLTSTFSNVALSPIDLPREKGEGQEGSPSPFTLVLNVSREGSVSVDGREYRPEELSRLLADEAVRAGGPDNLDVLVRGDRLVPASRLDPVVGVLSAAGVRRWKLATAGGGPAPTTREGGR